MRMKEEGRTKKKERKREREREREREAGLTWMSGADQPQCKILVTHTLTHTHTLATL